MGLYDTDAVRSSVKPKLTLKDLVHRSISLFERKSDCRQLNSKPYFYTFDNDNASKSQDISIPRRDPPSPLCAGKSFGFQYLEQKSINPQTYEDYLTLSNSSNLSHIAINSQEDIPTKKLISEVNYSSGSLPSESELNQMQKNLKFSKHGSVYSNLTFYQKPKSWLDKSFYSDDDNEETIEGASNPSIPDSFNLEQGASDISLISLNEIQPDIVSNPFGRPQKNNEEYSRSLFFPDIKEPEEIRMSNNPFQVITDGQSALNHSPLRKELLPFWTEPKTTNNDYSLNQYQSEPKWSNNIMQETRQIQNVSDRGRVITDSSLLENLADLQTIYSSQAENLETNLHLDPSIYAGSLMDKSRKTAKTLFDFEPTLHSTQTDNFWSPDLLSTEVSRIENAPNLSNHALGQASRSSTGKRPFSPLF